MLPIESMTNEQLQNEIIASQHRMEQYIMYIELISDKLEKTKNDQPIKFTIMSQHMETMPKEEKIKRFEESIKKHTIAATEEQQNLENLKQQLYNRT